MYRQKYRMEHLGRGISFSQILQGTTEIVSAIVQTKWEISKTYINIAYMLWEIQTVNGKIQNKSFVSTCSAYQVLEVNKYT